MGSGQVRNLRLALTLIAVVALLPAVAPSVGAQERTDDGGGLMLVLDSSGSMAADAGDGQTRIQAARAALTSLVDEFPADVQVGLTVYGHRVGSDDSLKEQGCQDIETITPVGPLDRAQLTEDVTSFEPSGYTPIGASLQQAADQLANVEGRRTIVLVSDGIDTCAPPDPCQVAEGLAAEGIDLTVEAIGFQVEADAREQLQCIAETTGGSYRDAPDAGSLSDSLHALSLRAYRDYQPTGQPVTGGTRRDDAADIDPGSHLDTLTAGTERWYAFDVPDGQEFTISATAVPQRGGRSDHAMLEVRVLRSDGDYCDHSFLQTRIGAATATVSLVGGPDRQCSEGPYVARVSIQDFNGEPVELPLELNLDVSPPGERIPLPEGIPPAKPGDDVTGGASFASAPLVVPGTYQDNIRNLEIQHWAIEVDRGQTLTVTYSGDPLASEEEASVKALVHSGLRVGSDDDNVQAEERGYALADGFEIGFTTPAVGGPDVPPVLERPGLYYVVVSLCCGPETALVDYELTLAVEGEPQPEPTPSRTTEPVASPSASPSTGPSVTASPAPDTTEAAAPGEDPSGTSPWLWVLAGLLVLAGLAGGGWAMYRAGQNAPRPDA